MPPPTPSTAPARSLVGGSPGGGGSKTASKSIKKSVILLDRFLIRFGIHFGAFWSPFWRQNRPKFRPRCPSTPHLLQKRDVHETLSPMDFNDFSAHDGSDNDQKLAQDQSKTVPKAIFFHVEF